MSDKTTSASAHVDAEPYSAEELGEIRLWANASDEVHSDIDDHLRDGRDRRWLATIDLLQSVIAVADKVIDHDLGICTDHAGNCCVDWCADCQRSEAAIAEHAKLSNAYRAAREKVSP